MIEAERIQKEKDFDAQRFYDELDFERFNRNQLRYYQRFIEFFERNGVGHVLERAHVAGAPAGAV
jgi:hypothetical protein